MYLQTKNDCSITSKVTSKITTKTSLGILSNSWSASKDVVITNKRKTLGLLPLRVGYVFGYTNVQF